jgi:thiamine kinase-like enzyme
LSLQNAEGVARRLWPERTLRVEPLTGGITNENFRVDTDGETFVLRIGGKDTELLGIDRGTEHGASLVAARSGVGPAVVDFVEPEGYLVTRYIEGAPVPPESMRSPDRIGQVAGLLRRIHDGPPIPGRFDSFRVVEDYLRIAEEHGVREPPAYPWATKWAGEIESVRRGSELRACHNDLLNANFIDDGSSLRVVDWEYAGMGDPFFDLANFSINHELSQEHKRDLLAAYFGEPTAEQSASLELMSFMSDFREAMWGVVQQGISELDVDFVAYADEHFERLHRTAESPAFRAAFDATTGGGR